MSDYSKLKSLSELGITPGRRNPGRKQFRCQQVSLNALVGSVICILDFETGVSTKWSRAEVRKAAEEQGEQIKEKTKYLVCARVINPNRAQLAACNLQLKKGDVIKFFTCFDDMCDICDELKDAQMLNENRVTITRNATGSFTEYLFT